MILGTSYFNLFFFKALHTLNLKFLRITGFYTRQS